MFHFSGCRASDNAEQQVSDQRCRGRSSFTRENYYGQEVTKNAEGFFGIDAQFFKLYSPKVDITSQFAYKPNFTTRGRRRLEFNSKLRIEVLKDFFVNLTFYDSYDSRPPSETATKNDYGSPPASAGPSGDNWAYGSLAGLGVLR